MKHVIIAAVALALSAPPTLADGDPAAGEQVAKQCMACHSLKDQANKVGPSLLGLFGRRPASFEGYTYSDAFKTFAESTSIWDEAALDAYLKDPKGVVHGTKMAFGGITDDAKRANLIAYLKMLK